MAAGIATGKQQLTRRLKEIVASEHLNLDVDRLLAGEHGKRIEGFGG